jgi:hypothetical protein
VDVTGPVLLSDDIVWSSYFDQFLRACEAIGFGDVVRRLLPTACRTVHITVAELYDQTPGVGAGRPLTGGDRPD